MGLVEGVVTITVQSDEHLFGNLVAEDVFRDLKWVKYWLF